MELVLDHLGDLGTAGPLIVRFEVEILRALGFGLDLKRCAATGGASDLVYVSPKSGAAVSREAGAPYRDRLLPLPGFLTAAGGPGGSAEVAAGFGLTGHFLERHVFGPRGLDLPEQRSALTQALAAQAE
jgi:DNA repair protein RecO (recombination protein O)